MRNAFWQQRLRGTGGRLTHGERVHSGCIGGDESGGRVSGRVTGFREKRRGGNRRRRPPGGCVPGGLGGYAEGACLWNNIKLSV